MSTITNLDSSWRTYLLAMLAFSNFVGSVLAEEVTSSPNGFSPFAAPIGTTEAGPAVAPETLLSQPMSVGEQQRLPSPEPVASPVNHASRTPGASELYPIDLPTTFALVGGNNLQIRIAAERVNAASARLTAARALWIPSISAGPVYNNHSGRIQDTEGNVIEVSRSSLFTGGAAVLGSSPANGGSGGPARMFVDLSLADAYFQPLAAQQLVRAAAANRNTAFNDTLLEAGVTYLSLAQAQAQVDIADEAVRNAEELVRLTKSFVEAGRGLQADADRALIEAAARRRDLWQAREQVAIISADLSRQLRLPQSVGLAVADSTPLPLSFVESSQPLDDLVAQALVARPELARADAQRDAAAVQARLEQVRPWVPNLYVGASAGGFGGSDGSQINNFGGRADFDVAALWQVENLGFGNAARQREQRSLAREAGLVVQQTRDTVAAEVSQAYHRVVMRQRQIEVTEPPIESAVQAVKLNLQGIQAGELRPIEIQQAIGALAVARSQYLQAVIDYNVAQLALLRAIGQPPEMNSYSSRQ